MIRVTIHFYREYTHRTAAYAFTITPSRKTCQGFLNLESLN